MIVHFHVGRSHAPVDVACFHQTIEIDGRVVYDEGKLTIWDDLDVHNAVNVSGMTESMTVNTPIGASSRSSEPSVLSGQFAR